MMNYLLRADDIYKFFSCEDNFRKTVFTSLQVADEVFNSNKPLMLFYPTGKDKSVDLKSNYLSLFFSFKLMNKYVEISVLKHKSYIHSLEYIHRLEWN